MSQEFFEKAHELSARGEAFATATVVKSDGSASARAGAKAIIQPDGTTLFGWVGGGCVESNVAEEALAALSDGKTRLLHVDLTSEVFGVGMPCGGSMDIYIEPHAPNPQLLVLGHGAVAESLARLGALLGFTVTVDDPLATREAFPAAAAVITEDPELKRFRVTRETFVVVGTQHKSDDLALAAVLGRGAAYVGLIASRKRAEIVFQYLLDRGVPRAQLAEVRSPAGLDIGAREPEEIAFSILGEIVLVRRGGSGRPLVEVKGPSLPATAAAAAPPEAARPTPKA